MSPVRRHAERGYTLIELVLFGAFLTLIAGLGAEALAGRPAQARTTATAFGELVAQARALAAVTGGADGSGATIGVVRVGDVTIATLYAYRPMRGALRGPERAARVAPLRTATRLRLGGASGKEPPFALFIAASGHLSAQAPFTVGIDAPLAAEPDCPLETGIAIGFEDGVHDQVHTLSCEMARLDLDGPPGAGNP